MEKDRGERMEKDRDERMKTGRDEPLPSPHILLLLLIFHKQNF